VVVYSSISWYGSGLILLGLTHLFLSYFTLGVEMLELEKQGRIMSMTAQIQQWNDEYGTSEVLEAINDYLGNIIYEIRLREV
jgi:hypothetical protein